ncbi:MAG: ATP-binding protein [Desulfonauticus sp.]|nr:ATP-binding protein [Desulfonauticus sp.]
MKKLPIGIQTFSEIIGENYYYVDKTYFVKKLSEQGKYFFLSRPRRFGKSLFISTLKEAFLGNKELFKGLYLYENWDWNRKHPVIHISFGTGEFREKQGLRMKIEEILLDHERLFEVKLNYPSQSGKFKQLIEIVSEKYKEKVVVLIDEYDKPILDSIDIREICIQNREVLKNFYSVLKETEAYLEFVFITGVSKFSKVSIFSGLNQLRDITLSQEYSTICGYTQKDLETVFFDRIKDFDLDEIARWYNGYSWLGERVYNPFDVLLLFAERSYRPYWFETGTPTFLIKLLMEKNFFLPQIEELKITDLMLESFDIDNITPENILFQTGYLTIKDKYRDLDENVYVLSYPNKEVKLSLNKHIIVYLLDDQSLGESIRFGLRDEIRKKNFYALKEIFYSFFASIPYFWTERVSRYEGFYASVIYSLIVATGFEVRAEDVTNRGRIDLTILYKDTAYIIEFKVVEDTPTQDAISQIKEKRYFEKYKKDYKEIYLIGIEFSKKEKNIVVFEWEKIV